jgi:PKD repeat protein
MTFDATANPAQAGPAVLAAVTELALAPTANAGGPYTGLVGTPVDFDGSGSAAAPPADVASYTWDFGDGSAPLTVSTPAVSHTYAAPLDGTVKLTVTDTNGKTGVSTAPITVTRPRPTLAVDTTVSADDGRTPTLTAPALTTAGPDELIVVTVSADGQQGSGQQVQSVSGGGLTFRRAAAATTQPGAAEVWTAFATTPLAGVRIAATLSQSGFDGTITVVALAGARSTTGAVTQASGRGNATAALTTTAADSLLLAVGHDWSHSLTPTLGTGHEFVHVFADTRVNDTSWTERPAGLVPAAGTSVPFQATLRANDRWNLAAVEVAPAT